EAVAEAIRQFAERADPGVPAGDEHATLAMLAGLPGDFAGAHHEIGALERSAPASSHRDDPPRPAPAAHAPPTEGDTPREALVVALGYVKRRESWVGYADHNRNWSGFAYDEPRLFDGLRRAGELTDAQYEHDLELWSDRGESRGRAQVTRWLFGK